MKKLVAAFAFFTSGPFFVTALSAAQPPPPGPSAAERAWMELQAPTHAMAPAGNPAQERPADPAAAKAAQAARAGSFVVKADQAKAFYTQYPDHAKANEARLAEVRALVSANRSGDATQDGRLAATITALRADPSVPANLRVQAVAAYSFSRGLRGAKNREESMQAVAKVARSLAVEFPDQPQGPESLVNLAAESDEATARQLASEVLNMPASAAIKQSAQTLLGRLNLVGKPIAAELDGADLASTKAALVPGRPTIIYTWALGSPGSLKLAADLKQRNPAANIIGLNLDKDPPAAAALAQKEGLVGTMIYDERGREGALAQRLKVKGAAQVIMVDAQGVIREVRGEMDLLNKLTRRGL
jgi:hypothetical protein